MLTNGTQTRKPAGMAPGWNHLRPGGCLVRECRPGNGRNGHLRLLALVHPLLLLPADTRSGIMGETGPVDNHIENPVKKGCNPAEAGIREHIQGGPQPGRPIYFAPYSNRAMKNLCLECQWYYRLGGVCQKPEWGWCKITRSR